MLAPCLDEVENNMTKNQTIEDITTKYLDNDLVINSPKDILKIPGELTEKINEAFDEHNVICAKDEKWKKPDVLEFAQVALILLKVFIIKLILLHTPNIKIFISIFYVEWYYVII